ncbi:thioesterase family protein [Cryobacterium sp. TMS1-13-1]|uniref:acyl-CoA thioesterase n=1 Tax=Cryobacterium sp. TMS1-13-1 TaxID=1259220 RepID=UPI00141A70E7|nr:thioesterase family protein [Cryobacterium sp. TMS1-13-1]
MNETTFTIRFSETDMAGVFHHSNMFVWFEVGRFNLLSHLMNGDGLNDLNGEEIFAPVTKTRVSFTGFGRFGEELRVQTFLKPQETTKLVFYYRVTKIRDGSAVATGMTEHVALTSGHRFLFRWPEPIRTRQQNFFRDYAYVLTDGSPFDAKL